jgi:hypothetical protein
MLLQMNIAFRPAVSAFLTTWSYEEFFHGYDSPDYWKFAVALLKRIELKK